MYGATELPVTESGLRDIAKMAEAGVYPDPDGAELYTSGMVRTEQTFEMIYGDAEHKQAPLLKEINLGKFEMMSVEEILEDEYGRAWLSGAVEDPDFEGGDSFSGFIARTTEGIRQIIDDCIERDIDRMIVVVHGAVISSIMNYFFPDVYDDMWKWTPAPGCGYEIVLMDGIPAVWSLVGNGDTGRVPGVDEGTAE